MRQAIIRRKGRRLVGVSAANFSRLVRLRKTSSGELPITAVVARALELGLTAMEKEDQAGRKE